MPFISFKLNGKKVTKKYEEKMTLLEVLRENCHITSMKNGCSKQGFCGACTVLVDGKAVLSCLQKPENIEGKEVVTLEGVPEREKKILSEAFVKEGAIQCGYCTPGIMIKTKSLLDSKKSSTREEKAKALSGHLCRCTGYLRILDAMESAEEVWGKKGSSLIKNEARRADYFGSQFGLREKNIDETNVVGAPFPRYRGLDMALGKKLYVDDMAVKGMAIGKVILSSYPRAKVLKIDYEDALKVTGVLRVFTSKDVPGERVIGHIINDWPIFIAEGEEVKCIGDVIALVVADNKESAETAASLVKIDYEPLDPLTDPEVSLAMGAPKIGPKGNLLELTSFKRGDVEKTFKSAAYFFKHRFTTQRIEHAYLEVESCLVVPQIVKEMGKESINVHVYSQGQGVHEDQRQIAAVLGLKKDDVTVELVTNGGAFGGKEDLSIQAHTALAAYLLRRPVKITLTREESLLMHPKRHPFMMDYEIAADKNGKLTAARIRLLADSGAHASVGAKVIERAAGHSCGPYYVPNVDVEARAVYTNNPPCGAMRGFGVNQTSFAMETMLDILAEEISKREDKEIDGYDIRERNILEPGKPFATGQILGESARGLRRSLEAVKKVYKDTKTPIGIACGIKNTGIGNGLEDTGRVLIRILKREKLEILTGFTEMGQGLFTILVQVVSEITGLNTDRMTVKTISLQNTFCGMTTASRATALDSMAAKIAAEKLASALKKESLKELEGKEFLGEYICRFTVKPGTTTENPVTHLAFSFATQVALLNEEGKLEKVIAAHDVGKAINPLNCAGQIEGGIHMGLGHAVRENFPCEEGRPKSLRMKDLGIIKAKEMPDVDVILIEESDPVGGFGSKGVGEIGLVPTAGAVAGALYQLDKKRRFSLPLEDGDKILK